MIRINFTAYFSFILIVPLFSQEISVDTNYIDNNGLRQGFWERKYPTGNVQFRGVFKNNHPIDKFERYFPNGNKMADLYFCEEGRKACAVLYYENGGTAARGNYIDEQKDSIWSYFSFYNGRLTSTDTWVNGAMEGIASVYYPDGGIAETFFYENDIRNGPWRQYYENGVVRLKSSFENDQRHGEFILYTSAGTPEMRGKYYRNLMHGEWVFYDDYGKVISTLNYIEGVAENEEELIQREQEMFRKIEKMRGRIPEPNESELFIPRRH